MSYLLETNVWVELIRKRPTVPVIEARINRAEAAGHQCFSTSIVLYELLHGAKRSQSVDRSVAAVHNLLIGFESLPFDDLAADHAAAIRVDLAGAGRLIGPMDILIAAIARANNVTLVTHNTDEFSRVKGLKIEDWQVPPADETHA